MSNVAASPGPRGLDGVKESSPAEDGGSAAQGKAQEAVKETQKTLQQQIDRRAKQAGEQVTSTAEDLRSVGEELRKQGKDGPAKIAGRAAEQTEKVGSYLSGTGPDQMLHDAEDFGRQRPWAMLAGGLAIGAVAARFLKASSRSRYQQRSASSAAAAEPSPGPGQMQPPAAPVPPEPAGSPVVGP